ncbi:MAG: type 1 glutamine amidotransferase domain-containing protein [Pantoea sp.]|uniref:type 1 glutamine amidotransferase domain-containing protein n=1 Tax=Pantoea sp. TaxID=69393 RepID=UPI002383FFE4|nr:type 1 glutamine amidotransferase domain-containing protein [Pantoea sp.]MDE1186423.1 type 1 glutamine amidotransferase domain-containing protein [Pantoea sp.]
MMSVKKILFVLTSHNKLGSTDGATGFYLPELTHPLEQLEKAGFSVDFASIKGGKPPVYGVELEDPVNAHYWRDETFQYKLAHTAALEHVDAALYAGVLYVGGHGTMWDFPESAAVQRVTREIWQHNGVVAAVCHGPSALVNVTLDDGELLVAGKQVSAFTDEEEHIVQLENVVPFLLTSKLQQQGAIIAGAAAWQDQVSVDGHLVTGQNPQSAANVGKAIVKILQG